MSAELQIVSWKKLKELGWPYSRAETWRRIHAGRFPKPKKLGHHRNSHPVWSWVEIKIHLESFGLVLTDPETS